jgi:hypothetical protein
MGDISDFGLRILENRGQLNDSAVGAAFQLRSRGFNDLSNQMTNAQCEMRNAK